MVKYKYESPDVLKEIYNSNIFFDERDTEIIFELANSLRVLPQAPRSSLANQNIVASLKSKDVSTVLGEYKSVLETVLVEEFIPVKETMEELFPGYND